MSYQSQHDPIHPSPPVIPGDTPQQQPVVAGSDPALPPPGPLAPPPWRRFRLPIVGAAAVVAVLSVSSGVFIYHRFIATDPGIAMCEALRDDGSITSMGSDRGGEYTEAEYRDIRGKIRQSRYENIREHGTKFIDVGWQVTRLSEDPGPGGGALAYMGTLMEHMSALQSACADQDIIIDLKNQP